MIPTIPRPSVDTDELHSEYSPSGSKRWITCPGSVSLVRKIPKVIHKVNTYAEEGTAAHELASFILENPDVSIESQLGKIFNNIIVSKEMIKEVKKYIEYVDSAMQLDTEMWVEVKVPFNFIDENQLGTFDTCLIFNEETNNWIIEVIDFKYGKGIIVEAKNNYQLKTYACGVLAHFAKHGIRFSDYDTIKLTIVQPRAFHPEGFIRSDFVNVKHLREFKDIAVEAVRLSKLENPPFNPSEEACLWCEAKPLCRAYAEFNLSLVRMEFEDLIKEEESSKDLIDKLDKTFLLSKEEVITIYKHSKMFLSWLDSIQEFIKGSLQSGIKMPGYKLVHGRSNRIWQDEEKLKETILFLEEWKEDLGIELSQEDLYNKKLISPSQAEKLFDDLIIEHLKPIIFKPAGVISVALETDPRPAIDPNKEAEIEWKDEDENK